MKAIERLFQDLSSADQNDEVLALMDQAYAQYEAGALEMSSGDW